MAIPYEVSFWHYRGLFLSCKTVHAEMEDECGKLLGEHLRDLATRWPAHLGMTMSISGMFSSMRRVVLDVPFATFMSSRNA